MSYTIAPAHQIHRPLTTLAPQLFGAGCDNQGVSFATLRLFSAERAERLRKRGMVVSRPGLKYSELR